MANDLNPKLSPPFELTKYMTYRYLSLRCSLAAVLLAACATNAFAAQPPAIKTISTNDLMRHIRFLADDKLEGRESGGPGNPEATKYVAKEFRKYGLKPLGESKSLLQPFEIGLNAELDESCALSVRVREKREILKIGKDYLPFDNIDKGGAFGPMVFAGFGITAPKEGYDDYAGINATNKIVLILRRTPDTGGDNALFKSVGGRPNQHALFTTKLDNAKKHGAKAILIVDATKKRQTIEEMSDGGPWRMGRGDNSLPFAFVSYEKAVGWFESASKDFAETVAKIDADQKPASFPLSTLLVNLNVKIRRDKAKVNNVIGLLEGSDPKLKQEYLVVGGHHDHVGYGRDRRNRDDAKFIHNGADDNASGTSAVLEIAQAFTSAKSRPKRSIIFMTFNAEERGLIGSRHYVNNPLVPLTNTIAMINLDMVGRGAQGLDVGGVGTSPGFLKLIKDSASDFDLNLTTNPGGKAPSDNTSFYNKDMPVLFFYTGRHDDYHKPTDDWQKIDQSEIGEITRMAYVVATKLANAPERPKFTKSDGNPVRRGRTRLLLGIVIDTEYRGEGVRAADVDDRFPAGKAGIRKGDILKSLDGKPMGNVGDIGRFLSRKKKGDVVKAKLTRDGKPLSKELKF